MNPIIRREKIIELKSQTDDLKNQVIRYFDLLMETIEDFHSNILSDQLRDPETLIATFQELMQRRGAEIQNLNLYRVTHKVEQIHKYIDSRIVEEGKRFISS